METLESVKTRVYKFGNKTADGNSKMKNLLGGKGANLAEMSLIGIPVPPGFTITTEVCTEYNLLGQDTVVKMILPEVEESIENIEKIMGAQFGDKENPLLVSVRSGARVSMPGMMDTVLNLGLNDEVVVGLAKKTNNERFAWDSYRRFIQMYGDVVLGMKPESKEDIDPFEEIMEALKHKRNIELDTEFTIQDLKDLVFDFKEALTNTTLSTSLTVVLRVFTVDCNEAIILLKFLPSVPKTVSILDKDLFRLFKRIFTFVSIGTIF